MLNKPEKKDLDGRGPMPNNLQRQHNNSYNQDLKEYEEFLPDVGEIEKIIEKFNEGAMALYSGDIRNLAELIAKRIGKL